MNRIIKNLVKSFPKNIIGCKDSSYNLYEELKLPNFLMFPGSETKLLKGLEIGCIYLYCVVRLVPDQRCLTC